MSVAVRQSWESHVDALSCFPQTKEAFRKGLVPQAALPGAARDDAWWSEYDRKIALFCARAEVALSKLPDAVGQAKLAGIDGDANLALFVRTFRQKRLCFFAVPLVAGWKGHTATSCATQLTPREDMLETWGGVIERFDASLSGANSTAQRTSRQRKSEAAATAARVAAETAAAAERARQERIAAEDAERAARHAREERERREREERDREDRRREREDREAREREDRKREREDREERDARAQAAQQATFAMMFAMLRGAPVPFEAPPAPLARTVYAPTAATAVPPVSGPPSAATTSSAAAAVGTATASGGNVRLSKGGNFTIVGQL